MGVANCNRGREGLEAVCPGICKDKPVGCGPPLTGLTLGEGGMARPNLGVLVPLFCRLPGMGGRSKGAGEDILGCWFGSRVFEDFPVSARLASSS
jgi:hypothetical protein